MFYEGIDSIPLCECGKPVKFHGYMYGFSKFCCQSCAGKNDEVQSKLKNTLIDKHGENYREQIAQKTANTKLVRYGDSKYNNSTKNKQTCLERYGVDNPMKHESVKGILLLLFSRSVVSDSLQPHGLQHTRPPCPSPSPEICPRNECYSQETVH